MNWRGLTLERAARAFALGTGLLACLLPLTRTIGPESALLFALVLSPWAGALGAKAAQQGAGRTTGALLAGAIGESLGLVALSLGLLALNGLRTEACDPWSGLRFMALGPAPSLVLSSVLGAALGSALPPKPAKALSVLAPLLEVGRAAYGFVASPAIFAFGHFFGYFPGTFYDRRVEVPDAWLTHRALTALIAAGLWALLTAARDAESGRLSRARLLTSPLRVALGCALGLASASMVRSADALRHASSADAIAEQLGLALDTARCHVVVPRELPRRDAERLAEDCEFRVTQIERLLGVEERERITAFFFRNANEKRQLMGAARVYIAKPWRREVYLQLGEYPHPVLAHELAHIVARHASTGPFGVPGRLFGLIPEPTLVEGMAVALEPHARDELTPHQWAKAAQAEKFAPPLSALLGAGFFGTNQQLAYTLAGSFLRFVLETRGAATLRKVYALGSASEALGKSLPELEREWRAYLAKIPLPAPAAALARLRFRKPGVLSQVCPHLVERLENELSAALSAGDLERAVGKCREVLKIDPNDTSTRATLAGVLARVGEASEADAEITRLVGPAKAPLPTVARARMAMADASFARGELLRATEQYRALLDQPQGEDELRQLEVRLLAVGSSEPARSILRELLVGEPFRHGDNRVAMHLIHALAEVREDGLAAYLEARQLASASRHELALPLLRRALARGLPSERLRVEALRMQVEAAFVTGSLNEADAIASELARRDGASLADQLEAADWRERVAFRRSEKEPKGAQSRQAPD